MLSRLIQTLYSLRYFPGQWKIAGVLRKALPKGLGLFRDRHGIQYFVHQASHVGHALAIGDPGEVEIMQLVPGDSLGLVVDLGCNVGTFALPLARRARQIICVDADPDQIELLRRNCEINGIRNVTAIHAAVTSRNEAIEVFHIARSLKDLSSRDPEMLHGRDRFVSIEVPTISVAAIVDTYGPVDLLKIDIEGFSGDAILSLKDRLPAVKRVIAEPSKDFPAVIPILEQAGLKITQPYRARADLADHIRYTWLAER